MYVTMYHFGQVEKHGSGADSGFSLGGGGGGGAAQKILCAHAHHKREARSPLQLGSRAHLRALEALGGGGGGGGGGGDALSCYLSLFLSILIQNGILKNIVDQI